MYCAQYDVRARALKSVLYSTIMAAKIYRYASQCSKPVGKNRYCRQYKNAFVHVAPTNYYAIIYQEDKNSWYRATMLSFSKSLGFTLVVSLSVPFVASGGPLKVFLLAGQSNMVGAASIDHLDLLVQGNESSNEIRDTLWNGTTYMERDDVFIKRRDNHGKLTVDRTALYTYKDMFGPELMIGWTLGDALKDEKILLIKTAWGGKKLAIEFRPPSAGQGNFLNADQWEYGYLYRAMITDALDTLSNLTEYIPDYDENAGYELSGFVWLQGFGDMRYSGMTNEYGTNLVDFIRDVRLDLDAPELPFSKFRPARLHCLSIGIH